MHSDGEKIILEENEIRLLGLDSVDGVYPRVEAADLLERASKIQEGLADAINSPQEAQRGLNGGNIERLNNNLRKIESLRLGISVVIEEEFAKQLDSL